MVILPYRAGVRGEARGGLQFVVDEDSRLSVFVARNETAAEHGDLHCWMS